MGIDGDWERGRVWFKNYERRNVQLLSTTVQTTHPLNWCTQEKLCQNGMRTSKLCGVKPWTKRTSENRRNRRPHG